jgi:acetoacetyl-CoA synthetase
MDSLEHPVYVPLNPEERNIEKFRREINKKRGIELSDYHQLHTYSVHPNTSAQFWLDVWEYVGIEASNLPGTVLQNVTLLIQVRGSDDGQRMFPPPRFFPDARLNFAENMLVHGKPEKIALIGAREGGTEIETVTYAELKQRIARLASAMRQVGVRQGESLQLSPIQLLPLLYV